MIDTAEERLASNPVGFYGFHLSAVNGNSFQRVVGSLGGKNEGLRTVRHINKHIVTVHKVKHTAVNSHVVMTDNDTVRIEEHGTNSCVIHARPTYLLHTFHINGVGVDVRGVCQHAFSIEGTHAIHHIRDDDSGVLLVDDVAECLADNLACSAQRLISKNTPARVFLLVLEVVDTLVPQRRDTHESIVAAAEAVLVVKLCPVGQPGIVCVTHPLTFPYAGGSVQLAGYRHHPFPDAQDVTARSITVARCAVLQVRHVGRVSHRIVLHHHRILGIVQLQFWEVPGKSLKLRFVYQPRQHPSSGQSVAGIFQFAADTSRTARLQRLQHSVVTAHVA